MRLAEPVTPEVQTRRAADRAPVALGAVTLILLCVIAAYWPTVQSLRHFWGDYDNLTYTHGYLVAAVCAWLGWRARHSITAAFGHFSPVACGLLAVLSVAWGVAYLASLQIVHQVLLPLLAITAVASLAGWRAAAVLAFPIGFVYFAVPVWDYLNGALQQLTIYAVTALLKLFAIPAMFDGPFVHLGAGSFEIAGGCSGLHFFIVANTIAVLFGEIGHDDLRTRFKLVLIASAMALVMNWIRVATIIVAGYLTDMQSYLVQVDHYNFGWALFAVLLVVYFWQVPKWLKLQHRARPKPEMSASRPTPRRVATAFFATAVALAVVPVLVVRAQAEVHVQPPTSSSLASLSIAEWSGPLLAEAQWQPVSPGADAEMRAAYQSGTSQVEAYVAYFAWQGQGREIGGMGSTLLGDGWRVETQRALPATAEGLPADAVEAVDPSGRRWVVWHGYVVGNRYFSGELASKLYYPAALLTGQPQSRVLAVASPCRERCDDALADIGVFLRTAVSTMQSFGTVERST
jgi:exosortase A